MIDVDVEERLGAFHLDVKFAADAPIVGLFGRSGAGKTTIVNAIAGIGEPSRGSIRINDHVLFDSARGIDLPPEQRRIGYVFQDALLFPASRPSSRISFTASVIAPRPSASSSGSKSSSCSACRPSSIASRARCRAAKGNGSRSAGPCLRSRASC